MKKEYLISLLTTNDKVKNIILEASDCKEAELLASKKYPAYTVQRITADEKNIRFFTTMREMRKNK